MFEKEPEETEVEVDETEEAEEVDEMIEPDADPLDTEVEDADLFIGEGDEEPS